QKDGRPDAALADYRQARAELARLTSVAPDALRDRGGLGTACFVLGAILLDLKRAEEALEPMQQAVVHLEAVFQAKPGRAERRKALSWALFHLGEIQRRVGRPAEAAATAR